MEEDDLAVSWTADSQREDCGVARLVWNNTNDGLIKQI